MLMNETTAIRPLAFARRAAALALVAGVSTLVADAQHTSVEGPEAPLNLAASLNQPLNLASVGAVNYSSSTPDTSTTVDATSAGTLDLSGLPNELQPPPRRRYGRPRYNDSSHNPDGSNKYMFVVGGGLAAPVNDFSNYTNLSYGFQVGVGRNFNKNFALVFQYDYDNFGFKGATLTNQINLYNYLIALNNQQNPNNPLSPLQQLDGNSHVWSFTLNPTYTIYSGEGLGAYVVGGFGFYHKAANFTTAQTGVAYDPYYGYYQYQANQPIDQYFSNEVGFSGGFGLTYKPSRFAGERLYAEVRYHYMVNQLKSGITIATVATAPASTNFNDQYPQNSHRTAFIPVKVGIRF